MRGVQKECPDHEGSAREAFRSEGSINRKLSDCKWCVREALGTCWKCQGSFILPVNCEESFQTMRKV